MTRPRLITVAAGLALSVVLVDGGPALAANDVFGNVAPASPVPAGLAERYPLGNYALDSHFPAVEASLTGGVDASGVAPTIAHFLANTLWQLTAFLADTLVTLFVFAFSLDLVRGSEATGGAGALEPVGQAIRTLYADVLGQPWLVLAITVAGVWAMWRGLVQRRYTETAGTLALSLVYIVVALAFVTQPERTVGEAVRWTNQLSLAFLSLTADGNVSGSQGAKRAAADQLFSLLVYEPWAVLQFGGREHCVRTATGSDDKNPVSVPVRPLARDAATDAQLARRLASGAEIRAGQKTCINNRNKYAERFLSHPPGSEERDAEYKALNEADTTKLADPDDEYRLSVADKPAVDAMEEGGQYQRLLMALVVFAGELGAFLLLGALVVGVTLAQVLLLLLLAFAPVALILATIPGRGHRFFQDWLTRLAGFLLRKAAYSLVLAILLAVNAALASATSNLGWLLSFGLQALLFWTVFLYRRQLTGQLLAATTGPTDVSEAGRLAALYTTTRLATRHLRPRAPRRPSSPVRSATAQGGEPSPPPLGDTSQFRSFAPDPGDAQHAADPAGANVPHSSHQPVPPAQSRPVSAPDTPPTDPRLGDASAADTEAPRAERPEAGPGGSEADRREVPASARREPGASPRRGRGEEASEPPHRAQSPDSPLRADLDADQRRFDQQDQKPRR